MASQLTDVKKALKDTLAGLGLQVYPQFESVINAPACVISLDPKKSADFLVSMGIRGAQWNLLAYLLIGENDPENATSILDSYVTQSGPLSIREFVFSNRNLGLKDVTAVLTGWSQYGSTMTIGGQKYMGAQAHISVTIT